MTKDDEHIHGRLLLLEEGLMAGLRLSDREATELGTLRGIARARKEMAQND